MWLTLKIFLTSLAVMPLTTTSRPRQTRLATVDHASAFSVDPVEIFLTSSSITTQNLVVLSHSVCACRRSQTGRSCHVGMGAWLNPRNLLLSMCYHTLSNRLGPGGVTKKIGGCRDAGATSAWDRDVANP